MEQKPIRIERKDIAVETQTLNDNKSSTKDNLPLDTDTFYDEKKIIASSTDSKK